MAEISIPIDKLSKSSLVARNKAMNKAEYKNSKRIRNPDEPLIRLKKPHWIRTKLPSIKEVNRVKEIKHLLREKKLNSVCEEASCPNLPECFSKGTATFMIMGDICTRKCPFCDVAHGRPEPLDKNEPRHLAESIKYLGLNYVVITSVDRDDLKDGGAQHFVDCIRAINELTSATTVEILTPDFRRCENLAVTTIAQSPPHVFNHNIETVPRLYRQVRPGADYEKSLDLLKMFKCECPSVTTKSGLMVGIGETKQEVFDVIEELKAHGTDMLTIGQYLQPSIHHLPVRRYVSLEEFKEYADFADQMGFTNVASAPMVRSSYHADLQAQGERVS